MPKKKETTAIELNPPLFSLLGVIEGGSAAEPLYYATLAETIGAYKEIADRGEDTVTSLRFKGWVLAEGKELTELLDD